MNIGSSNYHHNFLSALFESIGKIFQSIGEGIAESINSVDRICSLRR